MFPPVFELCANNTDVKKVLGEKPTRLYLFGLAPANVPRTYAVWQNISGEPENYLKDRPDIDYLDVQINVYGDTAKSVREVVKALVNVLEENAYITRWGTEEKDTDTKLYRYDFDVNFITDRE